MKVLFKIGKSEFNRVVEEFKTLVVNDYYSKVGGAKSLLIVASELTWFEQAFKHTRFDIISCGYTILLNNEGVMYSTSAGNRWGVISKDGEYYSFYTGRRSRVNYIPCNENGELIAKTPVMYITSGPEDMLWHESEARYVIRRGAAYAAQYLANKYNGYPTPDDGVAAADIATWFQRIDEGFEVQVFKNVLQGRDPEKLILDTTRNRRIVVEAFDPIQRAAWSLLSGETRERILKYS